MRAKSQNAVTINAQCATRDAVNADEYRAAYGEQQMPWGLRLNTLPLSIVHRLPQSYRWAAGLAGATVEPHINTLAAEDDLIGLRLLNHDGASAWEVMQKMCVMLADIQVDGTVVEWQGEPCLFVQRSDESAATVRLKNHGVAIAETFTTQQR